MSSMQFKVAHISLLSFAAIQHCEIKYGEQVVLMLKKGGATMSRSFIVLPYITLKDERRQCNTAKIHSDICRSHLKTV